MGWPADQATPHGFVGIALLMQMCDRVTLYGFEDPGDRDDLRDGGPGRPSPPAYHYYDKIEPAEAHAGDVEFAVLRALDRLGVIRLCSGARRQECLDADRASFNLTAAES